MEEAAERIVELLRDPARRARMGRAAKEKARAQFLLTRYLEQHLDLYASLHERGKLARAAWKTNPVGRRHTGYRREAPDAQRRSPWHAVRLQ